VPEKAGYAKFRNPASRYPMAGVFVAKHKDGSVRVAVTGAGNSGVFRWTAAEQALSGNFSADALQGLSVQPSGMMGDIHGSPEYRANLVAVMARRAMQNLGGISM
jgi:carbon-monoxide dehydrogenase medium subunit